MNSKEFSKQYRIAPDKLRRYQEQGLLQVPEDAEGNCHFGEAEVERLCLIKFLKGLGLGEEQLRRYLQLQQEADAVHKQEQLKILKKHRFKLLEELHTKQTNLDQLDYLMYQLK